MEKYPLKIMVTNALTTRVGIADLKNSVAPAILVIEDMSLEKVKECLYMSNTPDDNGNNMMLVMDLVRNNKYYRIALSSGTLPKFLGLTTIDRVVLDPDEYKNFPDSYIHNYNVFEIEVLPESECLDLQKSTLEWFEDTYEHIDSSMIDATSVMREMYLSTTYNGRTVMLLSAVCESNKTKGKFRLDYRMQYLDSVGDEGNDVDMAAVADEVEAGNLQFRLSDIEGSARIAKYKSTDEFIKDLAEKGSAPAKLYEIASKDRGE